MGRQPVARWPSAGRQPGLRGKREPPPQGTLQPRPRSAAATCPLAALRACQSVVSGWQAESGEKARRGRIEFDSDAPERQGRTCGTMAHGLHMLHAGAPMWTASRQYIAVRLAVGGRCPGLRGARCSQVASRSCRYQKLRSAGWCKAAVVAQKGRHMHPGVVQSHCLHLHGARGEPSARTSGGTPSAALI